MAVDDAVRQVGPHLREIAALLGAGQWPRFEALLRDLAEADPVSRPARALRLVIFLTERLPPDHPVQRAMALAPPSDGSADGGHGGGGRRPGPGRGAELDAAVATFRTELARTEQAVELNPAPPSVLT